MNNVVLDDNRCGLHDAPCDKAIYNTQMPRYFYQLPRERVAWEKGQAVRACGRIPFLGWEQQQLTQFQCQVLETSTIKTWHSHASVLLQLDGLNLKWLCFSSLKQTNVRFGSNFEKVQNNAEEIAYKH